MKIYFFIITIILVFSCKNPLLPKQKAVHFNLSSITKTTGASSNDVMLYIDKNFKTQKISISSNTEHITLNLSSNHLYPILFLSNNSQIKPYGCIYPFSTKLTSKSGFTSFILYRFLTLSEGNKHDIYKYAAHFNWQYLDQKIQQWNNPWEIDAEYLLIQIKNGTFTARAIKKKK